MPGSFWQAISCRQVTALSRAAVEDKKGPGKKTFLVLLSVILVFLFLLSLYLYLVVMDPQAFFSRALTLLVSGVLLGLFLLFLGGFLAIFMSLNRKLSFPAATWLIEKTLLFLFPLTLLAGRLLNIPKERIQQSFIEVNNQLVQSGNSTTTPERVLLLLPHCLQHDDCRYRVTQNPENCCRCGNCQLAEILNLALSLGTAVEVVSGGTMARRALKKHSPEAVVAVACERDLSSGVLDSIPYPVLGIINERPEGPCYNTRVDLNSLEKALYHFINEKNKDPESH